MINLKYLTVGTGRCGTVYVAKLLTSLGVACGHECIFGLSGLEEAVRKLKGEEPVVFSYASTRNEGDWTDPQKIVAESSYMAVPFLEEDILKDVQIIHIVRNPLKVINSFVNHIDYFKDSQPSSSYENFIYEHLPELKQKMSVYERAALYYIRWNQFISTKLNGRSHLFVKAEKCVKEVASFIGCSSLKNKTIFKDKEANTFKKNSSKFSLSLINSQEIKKELIDLSLEYGYSISSEYLIV